MKLFAVIVLLLTGCASVNQGQVSPQTRENALNAQEKWLRGLERGQPIQETTVAIVPGTQYLLEIFQHGTLYQYISGMYPNTGVLYGLYFEAGRLKALLLDQDAIDFFEFEGFYRQSNDQWLRSGMARTNEWVETRDLLGRDFDARVTHPKNKSGDGDKTATEDVTVAEHKVGSTGGSFEDSVEIATTLFFLGPVLLAVAPVYLLSGGASSDDELAFEDSTASERAESQRAASQKFASQRAARQRAQSFVGELHPGTTTSDDMLSLMGPPEFTRTWVGGQVWVYDFPKISIGTADGFVMWKEIGRVLKYLPTE